jgi:hypothetical protein
MTAIAFSGMDEVMGFRIAWAFGYSPDRPGVPSRRGSTFGMVGANGSAAYADIDSGVAVAVMRNGASQGDLTAAARIDRLVARCCREPSPQAVHPARKPCTQAGRSTDEPASDRTRPAVQRPGRGGGRLG